jgi:tRNA 2-thiocytidine biosynthesis protein TtcA
MLQSWERKHPGRLEKMFRSLQNVKASHLADTSLYDFAGLKTQDTPFPEGDIAFDREDFQDDSSSGPIVFKPTVISKSE